MKFAKIAVIGQLAISVVLVGVFALKSTAKGDAHGDKAGKDVPALAAGHDQPGDHGAVASAKPAAAAADEQDEAEHGGKLALAADKPGKDSKDSKAGDHGSAAGGHGSGALAGDPKAIAKALLAGNDRFLSGHSAHPDLEQQRTVSAQGQHPGVMVLGCADSRVPPELIFDRGIGELFVVRSAGNIAEPVAVGSLEYAVAHLHAKVLVVMGHEKCGAVKAALSDEKMPTPSLETLVGYVAPAVKGLKSWADGDDLVHMAVEANVRRQADELLKRSPLLRQAVAKGEIVILKAVYDIETGRVRPI